MATLPTLYSTPGAISHGLVSNAAMYAWTILALLFLVSASPPYIAHIDPWGLVNHSGDRIAVVKTWWEYGCPREASELDQTSLKSDHCKNYKTGYKSMMWELWPRPEKPGKDDKTIWNCTLTVYEDKDCKGAKLVSFRDEDANKPGEVKCLSTSSPEDTDVVGKSLFVTCYGKTGHEIAMEAAEVTKTSHTSSPTGSSTRRIYPSDATNSTSVLKNTATTTPKKKTRYSTVWVPKQTTSVMTTSIKDGTANVSVNSVW